MAEIAKRWGYDIDDRVFIVQLQDEAPSIECTVNASTDSGQEASVTVALRPGAEILIPIEANEGEGVRAKFVADGKELDSGWLKIRPVTCPHCGRRIDEPESTASAT